MEETSPGIRPLLPRLHRSGTDTSTHGQLSLEMHRESCRRLAWLALIYSLTYLVVDVTMWILAFSEKTPYIDHFWRSQIHAASSIGFGLVVFFLAWSRRLPPTAFAATAVAFEIVAGLGIMWGGWGWETHASESIALMGEARGLDPAALKGEIVDPLVENGMRPYYAEGVPWVGVWLLVVPFILPLKTSATILGSLLTALTVPLVLFGSPAVNGYPETVAGWGARYAMEATVPALICAGIAVLGSRVLYQVTRQLSRARHLGSYQLVEKIGAGGMGEVWKAKHRMLIRPAAIKLIRPEVLGTSQTARTAIQRFEREAQVIATLTSPHTVVLYDFGTTHDGSFYYVMELLDGLDLRTLVETYGPVRADRACFFLEQVCHSLDDAHAHGLIHRDIKPGNVFTCRRGKEFDVVKVLDFGLVKEIGVGPGDVQLTTEGLTTGTPAFMAPEMVLGGNVDSRTDLYSLGCVGFWLLTGRLVFSGDSPMSIATKHAAEPPPRPSEWSELSIPSELDQIILDCLAKDPQRRPQSAHELSMRLRSISSSGSWTQDEAVQWWSSHLPSSLS